MDDGLPQLLVFGRRWAGRFDFRDALAADERARDAMAVGDLAAPKPGADVVQSSAGIPH